MDNTLYWQLFFIVNYSTTISVRRGESCGAATNPMLVVNLHNFPKEMKGSRLLSVSMLSQGMYAMISNVSKHLISGSPFTPHVN